MLPSTSTSHHNTCLPYPEYKEHESTTVIQITKSVTILLNKHTECLMLHESEFCHPLQCQELQRLSLAHFMTLIN